MAGRPYVILGGGGSFGLNTAKYFLDTETDRRVVGVGRASLRPSAFTLGLENHPRFDYRQYHIWEDRVNLLGFLDTEQPDVIVNFAAQGEGAVSWDQSWRFFHTNCVALSWLYEELEKRSWFKHGDNGKPPTQFIHIGTSELYGSVMEPAREDAPIIPTSPYAASKAAFDMCLLALRGVGRAQNTTILRPSNCYGPGQLLHRIIPRAIVCGLTGRKMPLHGGGLAKKSYMHIKDLARAIYMTAQVDARELRPVYNVGPEAPISIRELAEVCAREVGVSFYHLFTEAPERVGQDSQYWLDSSAIRKDIGWNPYIPPNSGINDVACWARENLDVLRDWEQDYVLRP